jgi:hypothetical protein
MIADGVEMVAVDVPLRIATGTELLVEHLVAQTLAGFDLASTSRKAQDKAAAFDVNV